MQRRDCIALLTLAASPLANTLAQAQGAPQEGTNFRRLPRPMTTNSPGKIELIEFFWYGCPHCFVFDPALKQWLAAAPTDVAFRRVHVGFGGIIRLHQRFFFTLEAMGVEAALHDRVFNAFHVERLPVDSEDAMQALAVKLGLDATKFRQAWTSFGVQSKCLQATHLSDDYGIDGVPALAVAGRFVTAPDMAGNRSMSEQQLGTAALRVTDYLISLARRG